MTVYDKTHERTLRENKRLQARIEELEEALRTDDQYSAAYENGLRVGLSERNRLRTRIEELESVEVDWKEDHDTLHRMLNERDARIEELEAHIESMGETQTATMRDRDAAKARIEELEAQRPSFDGVLSPVTEEIPPGLAAIEEWKQAARSEAQAADEFRARLAAAETERDYLQALLDNERAFRKQDQAERDRLEGLLLHERDEVTPALEAELVRLRGALEELEAEVKRLNDSEYGWTQDERRRFLFNATKASFAEGMRKGCEDLMREAAIMNDRIEELEAEHDRLQVENDRLRTEMARRTAATAKRTQMDGEDLARLREENRVLRESKLCVHEARP